MRNPISLWVKVALFNFLLAALIGMGLRFAFVNEVKWLDYKSFEEAHEHLALLGWTYQALFAFILSAFLPIEKALQKKYTVLFWCNQALILLIALNFIMSGLSMTANVLLTLFSVLVFYFIYSFIRDTSKSNNSHTFSYDLIKIALLFLGLSYVAVYLTIPIMMVSGLKKLLLYYLAEQFFLHFQYNGWFVFAVLALLFRLAENNNIAIGHRIIWLKKLLIISTVLSFFLSIYWGYQHNRWLLWIASAAGILQIIAVALSWNQMKKVIAPLWTHLNKIFKIFLAISILCFLLKLMMQTIIIVPSIASLAFTIRNYVIAYLHLIFIGFLSFYLFGWAIQHRFIPVNKTVEAGAYTFIIGFIAMEIVLFVQGTMLWMGKGFISFYYPLIFIITILLPLGLLLIFFMTNRFKSRDSKPLT